MQYVCLYINITSKQHLTLQKVLYGIQVVNILVSSKQNLKLCIL